MLTHQPWPRPPSDWQASHADVHVWLAELDQPPPILQRLEQTLSSAEQMHAQCFRFERDRQQFIVAHGLLRTILSAYLERAPAQLQFATGPYGKPALATTDAADSLHFNLSHSRDFVLYAIAGGRAVGVDIEYMRPLDDSERLARQFFSEHEQAALQNLPARLLLQAFYTCWTRKEAYIKATGDALSRPWINSMSR